jgi:pimeloyl-ACP methyl ester carboxylesterase
VASGFSRKIDRVSNRFLTSSGSELYFEETGTGPAILAVHGLGGGAWFFTGLARRLATEYRVVAIDLPGTGRSTTPAGGMSIERWVADLGELTEKQIGEPVVLLGHSMGTIIALHASAVWAPTLLRGLIFAGGLPEPLPPVKERLARRADLLELDGIEGTGAAVAAANFSPGILAANPELVGLFERTLEAQDAIAYARACRILMSASAGRHVETVGVPSLSISGQEDQYAPPEQVAAFVARVPGCGQELLADCGHFPFFEQPERFAALVRNFVASL